MRRLCHAVGVVGLLAVTVSAPIRAQGSDTLTAAQRAGIALARLRGGQRVRIREQHVFVIREGSVVTGSATGLTVITEGRRIEVPATDVDSLWVHYGNHAGKGALIGAIVGGLALGVFAVELGQANCQGQQHCSAPGDFAAGLLFGGAMGGGVGALIGATVPIWQLQVP